VIGLCEGMFESHLLTSTSGSLGPGENDPDFSDVRELKRQLEAAGVPIAEDQTTATESGPAHLRLVESGPLEAEVARVVALGVLIFVHVHYPDAPLGDNGVVDIFRVDDRRITEHWDVFQPTVPASESPSGNDMFSQLS